MTGHLQDSARRDAEPHPISAAERFVRLLAVISLLSVFLVPVDLLGGGIKGLGENFADALFRGSETPWRRCSSASWAPLWCSPHR